MDETREEVETNEVETDVQEINAKNLKVAYRGVSMGDWMMASGVLMSAARVISLQGIHFGDTGTPNKLVVYEGMAITVDGQVVRLLPVDCNSDSAVSFLRVQGQNGTVLRRVAMVLYMHSTGNWLVINDPAIQSPPAANGENAKTIIKG